MSADPREYRRILRRAHAGLASQDVASIYINAMARDLGIPSRTVRKARYGEKSSDLIVSLNGTRVAAEVKGVSSIAKPVPFFDRSVRRRSVPEDIEEVTEAYIEALGFNGGSLKRLMVAQGYKLNFLGMLDFFRDHDDPLVGLAEDPNSTSSGKLPRALVTRDPAVVSRARSVVVAHLVKSKDSYFVIHEKADDDVFVWHTGFGQNPLQAPPIPSFKQVALDTYGGASKGATRIAFKITL